MAPDCWPVPVRRRRPIWRVAQARIVAATGLAPLVALGVMLIGAGGAHADDWRNREWYLGLLKADKLSSITQGKGVTVAVIDSGVNGNHPDLKGNVAQGRDFVDPGNGWQDPKGHGTAMASLIAGHGHGAAAADGIRGLAPESTVLPVRVLSPRAKDNNSRKTHVDDGIAWATEHGATVINLSMTGGGLAFALEDAFSSDAVVVAGVGNTAQNDHGVQAPARTPGVVAVSGIDQNGKFTNKSTQGPEVVLAAPAVNLASAWAGKLGDYSLVTGTSGATALVSATAALIRAKYPNISANGVINRLISTADDMGPPGRDSRYGFGVVNPLKALMADMPDLKYNPLIKGTPGPTRTPTRSAGAGTDDAGGGYVLAVLSVIGGLIAVTVIATGAIALTRSRRIRSGM